MTARQGRLDVDPQASLFDEDEREQLAAIAEQCSDEDHEAMQRLGDWARAPRD